MRWEIVERQVAALIDCTADATLLLRFYGIAMMNAIELSHLYKCLHPSIDQAPLLVQLHQTFNQSFIWNYLL